MERLFRMTEHLTRIGVSPDGERYIEAHLDRPIVMSLFFDDDTSLEELATAPANELALKLRLEAHRNPDERTGRDEDEADDE